MSNMENFSAEELLKRLKENMGVEDDKNEQPKPDEVEVESETPEVIEEEPATEPETPTSAVRVKKKFKIAARAVRDVVVPESESELESESEQAKEDEPALGDETIAFDIPSALNEDDAIEEEPVNVFFAVSDESDEQNDAPTMEIPGITELEAPDVAAFEAAAEDSSPDKILASAPVWTTEDGKALDATDLSLIVALGDKETLEKAKEELGEDKFLEYTNTISISEEELAADEEVEDESEAYSGFAFSGDEYESHDQTSGIVEKYKSEKGRIKLRLFGSAVLALCLLIFENLHVWGITLPGAFNAIEYPAVHTFVCLQLLMLAAALSYKEIFTGFERVISMEFTTNTVTAFAVAFTALCDLLIGFFGFGEEPRLYNFAAVFVLVLCAFHDYLGIKREMFSFSIVSSKKPKYAVTRGTPLETRDHEFGFEQIFEEPDVSLKVKKVGFVNNYFARTNAKSGAGKYTPYYVFGAIAAALVFAVISAVTTKSAATAFEVANLTALMCLPISLFSSSALPFFLASKRAHEAESAIIGETSVNEYSGASVISFDDSDVFPARSVKVKSIKVYGEARIDTVLYDLTSVYSKLGGPLCEVLFKATAEIGASENVELLECADTGVVAKVDSERDVLIGDSAFMEQNDIFPVYDYEDEIQLAGGNIRIMYIAYNGELASKMYVQYAVDPDFSGMLRRLHRNGMKVVITTMDPNIDDSLLVGKAKPVNYPAKIEKAPIETAGMQKVDSLDSGIVSRANTKSLVSAILLCDSLQHVGVVSNIVKIMSVIAGLAIMAIFTFSGSSMFVLSWFVALYHLFWTLPVYALSKLYLK